MASTQTDGPAHKGRRWALLIGANRYHESLGTLKYCVSDCHQLANALTNTDGAFPAEGVLILADDQPEERRPTYANIHSWLASWCARPDKDDTLLLFFAGHGREMNGKSFIVPSDATLQTLHVTGIPVSFVQEVLGRCHAERKILVLDACHSGAGRDVATMPGTMMQELSAGKGIYTMTSCDVDELSHEWEEKKQGVFSHYLCEAISGACPPDSRGRITAEAVYDWTYERVRTWASEHRCSQTPKRFSAGAGAIAVKMVRPDWQRVAANLQERLEHTETELSELKAAHAEDKAQGELLAKARRLAMTFINDHEGQWDHKEWQRLLKTIRSTCPELHSADDEIGRLLEAERKDWADVRGQWKDRADALDKELKGARLAAGKSKKDKEAFYSRSAEDRRELAKKYGLPVLLVLTAGVVGCGLASILAGSRLLSLIGLACALGLAGVFAYIQWHWWRVLRGFATGVVLWLALVGFASLQLCFHPYAFLAYVPSLRGFVLSHFNARYNAAEKLLSTGQLGDALSEASALSTELRGTGCSDLSQLYDRTMELRDRIVKQYGPIKRLWADGGCVVRWNAATSQPEEIARFKTVDQIVASPDGHKLAFVVDDSSQIYISNQNGDGLVAVVEKLSENTALSNHGLYRFHGWKDNSTMMIEILRYGEKVKDVRAPEVPPTTQLGQ